MPQSSPDRLTCPGVTRMADNDKAVLVSFSRRLTDDELRFFHEVCQRSAPLMADDVQIRPD